MDPSKPKDQSIEDGDGQGEKPDVKVDEDPRWVGPATVEVHARHLFGLQKVLQVLPAIKKSKFSKSMITLSEKFLSSFSQNPNKRLCY